MVYLQYESGYVFEWKLSVSWFYCKLDKQTLLDQVLLEHSERRMEASLKNAP